MPHVRSTKPTSLAAGPPMLVRALATPFAALATAGPAAELTRERPSLALAAVSLAASVALEAAVLSKRRAARRRAGERSMGRASDCIMTTWGRRRGSMAVES